MKTISADDVKGFVEYLSKKREAIESDMGKALAQCCALVERDAKESMTNTVIDTEKKYFTHNKKIPHSPSVEGAPPAVDTGALRRSITYTVDEGKLEGHVGTVINNPPYGAYLEYGTGKMRPRPWLKPALERQTERIKELLAKACYKGLKHD